jgi:hypothetical protein
MASDSELRQHCHGAALALAHRLYENQLIDLQYEVSHISPHPSRPTIPPALLRLVEGYVRNEAATRAQFRWGFARLAGFSDEDHFTMITVLCAELIIKKGMTTVELSRSLNPASLLEASKLSPNPGLLLEVPSRGRCESTSQRSNPRNLDLKIPFADRFKSSSLIFLNN